MARSVLEHAWSEVRQWRTTHLSATSIGLALWDTSTSVISSAFNSGVQLVEGYCYNIVDYYDRTHRYLKAAKEYERTLYEQRESKDSHQQRFDPLVASSTSRRNVIETIAIRAGLRTQEIPYPALVLEGVVRKIEKWKHGDSLLLQVVQDLWRRLSRRFKRLVFMAWLFLIGVGLFANGRYLFVLAWLSLIIVLTNTDTISTWFIRM